MEGEELIGDVTSGIGEIKRVLWGTLANCVLEPEIVDALEKYLGYRQR